MPEDRPEHRPPFRAVRGPKRGSGDSNTFPVWWLSRARPRSCCAARGSPPPRSLRLPATVRSAFRRAVPAGVARAPPSSRPTPPIPSPSTGCRPASGRWPHGHPARASRRAAAGADPLARRRHGPAGRGRGGAGDDAAAGPDARRGAPACGPCWSTRSSPCSTPGSPRGARARLARLQRRPRAPGPRRPGPPRRGRAAPPGRVPAAGLDAAHARAKEGLALINGTDGMLGMLVLAVADLDALLPTADVAAAMSVEALLGTDRAFAADLQALRPHPGQTARPPTCAGCSPAAPSSPPPHRRPPGAGRLLAALRAAGARRGARHARPSRGRSPTRAALGDRQPGGAGRRPGRVAAATSTARRSAYACDFLAVAAADLGAMAERRTDRLLDRTRSQGLPPFLAADPGVDSGLMIAQYTRRRWSPRTGGWPPRPASTRSRRRRCRRTTCRWAGPPPASCGTSVADLGRVLAVRAGVRGPGPRAARSRCAGAGDRPRPSPRCAPRRRGPGPTGWLAPELARRRTRWSPRGGLLAAVEAAIGPLDDRRRAADRCRCPAGAGAARRRADLPGLAAGGGAADADEQPRPRGGRATRRPRGLRRHRPGGPVVGGVRRDRAHAAHAGRRRDAARAVGQARGRVPHPRVGAAGADRQLAPRARVGHVGRVPPARGARASRCTAR